MTDVPPEGPAADQTLGPAADWPKRAADAVQLAVDVVHDRAVRPALLAARVIVFGILIAFVAVVLLVLFCVGFIRLLDVYVVGGRVWISYAVLGALFVIAGFVAWSQRTSRAAEGG